MIGMGTAVTQDRIGWASGRSNARGFVCVRLFLSNKDVRYVCAFLTSKGLFQSTSVLPTFLFDKMCFEPQVCLNNYSLLLFAKALPAQDLLLEYNFDMLHFEAHCTWAASKVEVVNRHEQLTGFVVQGYRGPDDLASNDSSDNQPHQTPNPGAQRRKWRFLDPRESKCQSCHGQIGLNHFAIKCGVVFFWPKGTPPFCGLHFKQDTSIFVPHGAPQACRVGGKPAAGGSRSHVMVKRMLLPCFRSCSELHRFDSWT